MIVRRITYLFVLLASVGGCEKITAPDAKRGPVWIVYHPSNSPLLSDTINAIYIDVSGTKWFSTDNGGNGLTSGGWLKFHDTIGFPTPLGYSWKVNSITVGNDQSLWFGLAGGGVKRYNLRDLKGDYWVTYQSPTINADYVYSLATNNAGDIFVGTLSGVSRFIPSFSNPGTGTWYKYTSGNSPLPDEPIRSMRLNLTDNLIYFGTQGHGIVTFDGDLLWNIDSPSDQPFPILSMAFSPPSTAWFGTFADWAYRYSIQTNEWTHLQDTAHAEGLRDPFVNAVEVGHDGTVWFGTNKGLVSYNGNVWKTLTRTNSSIPSDSITALGIDALNNLWIGTRNGLAEYNAQGTASR